MIAPNMTHLQNLDIVLARIASDSKDLANIDNVDLSENTGLEIPELVAYLEVLKERGFISHNTNGSYINLKGIIALETSTNETPFQDEARNKRRAQSWLNIKIIAVTLNAIVILGIAFWSAYGTGENNNLKTENKLLRVKMDSIIHSNHEDVDSIKGIFDKLEKRINQPADSTK
jgi:hypothetical protein